MTDRLLLSSLTVNRFGGLSDRTVRLPDADFVVVHGANESGKSSLAELTAWLIAGHSGNARELLRFGEAGQTIGGRLSGTLGGEDFTATGSYVLTKTGMGKSSSTTVSLGSDTLTLDGWRQRLRGVDAAIFGRVYRLWGETLHDIGDVEAELARVAIGSGALGVNPRVALKALEDLRTERTKANGEGAQSVQRLKRVLDEVDASLRAARNNAEQYGVLQQEIDVLRARVAELDLERARATRHTAALRAVLAAAADRRTALALQNELDALSPVPAAWLPLAEDPERVDAARRRLEQATDDERSARTLLRSAAQELGCSDDDLAEVEITEQARTALVVRCADVSRLRDTLRDAEHTAALTRSELDNASRAAISALAAAGDLPRDGIDEIVLDNRFQIDLEGARRRWSEAIDGIRSATEARAQAQDKMASAASAVADAEANWERYGTGVTAEHWLTGAAGTAGQSTATSTRTPAWLAPAAVGALVVLALGLQQWVLAGVAAVIAVALLVVSTRRPTATPAATHTDDSAPRDAADRVRRTRDAHRLAHEHLDGTESVLAAAQRAHDDAVEAYRGIAALARIPVGATPVDSANAAANITTAAQALAGERSAERAVEAAVGEVNEAGERLATAESAVTELVQLMGVPVEVEAATAEAIVDRYRDAARRHAAAQAAEDERRDAEAEFERIVHDVRDADVERSPAWYAEEAKGHAQRLAQRAQLEDEIRQARFAHDKALGGNDEARALADAGHDEVALSIMLEEADAAERAAQAAHTEAATEIGRKEQAQQTLADQDDITRLRAEQGAIQERRRDHAIEGAAAGLAAALLRSVAEEYEDTRQPEIVKRARQIVEAAAPSWDGVRARREDEELQLVVAQGSELLLPNKLSTGARTLLYCALRIAMAEADAASRGIQLPLLLDDFAAHLDDTRATEVVREIAQVSQRCHQALLFTCHGRTVDAARAAGAALVEL